MFDSKYHNLITHTNTRAHTHTHNLGLDSIEHYYTTVMKFGNSVLLPTTWNLLRNSKKISKLLDLWQMLI